MSRSGRMMVAWAGLAALAVGCEKLTHERFQMIREGASTQLDVQKTLREPDRKVDDLWNWTKHDRQITCNVYFDSRGVVARKEWIDARKGIWEGAAPGVQESAEPSQPRPAEEKTTIRIIEP